MSDQPPARHRGDGRCSFQARRLRQIPMINWYLLPTPRVYSGPVFRSVHVDVNELVVRKKSSRSLARVPSSAQAVPPTAGTRAPLSAVSLTEPRLIR